MSSRESVLQRRISLGEMLDTESFTEVVKGFVELYRVGIKVFDDRGGKLADIKIGNGDFCGYVFSFPEGRRRCTARNPDCPECEVRDLCPSADTFARPPVRKAEKNPPRVSPRRV